MRFLFVDRIINSSRGSWIHGIKQVTTDDYYLSVTENGLLHFTPSLIGETLGQLAAWNVMEALDFSKRPVAGVAARAVVHRPVYIGETLLLEAYIDALDDTAVQYHSIARVNEEIVFTIDGALGPLLPMSDFINEDLIRRQFSEINRLGEWPEKEPTPLEPLVSLTDRRAPLPSYSFDALLHHEPGVSLTAIKRITRAAPYFSDHFPNKPVLPMTILLECQLQLAREFVKRAQYRNEYQVREMRRVKMNEFICPGDVVTCILTVKRQDDQELVLSFRSEVGGKRVCMMELLLSKP